MPNDPAMSFVGFVTTENLASALLPNKPGIARWLEGCNPLPPYQVEEPDEGSASDVYTYPQSHVTLPGTRYLDDAPDAPYLPNVSDAKDRLYFPGDSRPVRGFPKSPREQRPSSDNEGPHHFYEDPRQF